jgi:hypothetical protein
VGGRLTYYTSKVRLQQLCSAASFS